MAKLLTEEESKKIKDLLEKYEKFYLLLGKAWVEKAFEKNKERRQTPPLAWILLDDKKNISFLNSIQKLIDTDYSRLSSLIKNDLKKPSSLYELKPLCTELEAYRHFATKLGDAAIEFRPQIEGTGMEGDLKIGTGDKKIFIEILTVIDDQVTITQNQLSTRLSDMIDHFVEKRGIIVSIAYHRILTPEMVARIFKDLKEFVLSTDPPGELSITREDGQEIATVEIEKNANEDDGYTSGWTGPGRGISVGNREKNKILDKLDKYQFPETADFKGLIIHLDSMLSGEENILNAILGMQTLRVDIETGETIFTRSKNGIIHDKRAKKIDFIAYYRRSQIEDLTLLVNKDTSKTVESLFG